MFDLALFASWQIEFYGWPWLRCLPLFVETFSLYVYIYISFFIDIDFDLWESSFTSWGACKRQTRAGTKNIYMCFSRCMVSIVQVPKQTWFLKIVLFNAEGMGNMRKYRQHSTSKCECISPQGTSKTNKRRCRIETATDYFCGCALESFGGSQVLELLDTLITAKTCFGVRIKGNFKHWWIWHT